MALEHNRGHGSATGFADYAGVNNTHAGARIFGNDWGAAPPVPGVAGRPAQNMERQEYQRHLEPFQAAPYGHTDTRGRVLNGMARTQMAEKKDTTASALDNSQKWGAKPARSCKRVGLQAVPFGEGKNLRDSHRGRVTTKQMEYRAPSIEQYANPGRRHRQGGRHTGPGGQEAMLPARAASEELPRSQNELADAKARLQAKQSRMQWRESERTAEPFKARPMPDFSGGDEVSKELQPGGRRGMRRANAYLGEIEGAAHKSEIAIKRHREKILREEMEALQERRAASPGMQARALHKARIHVKRAQAGEEEMNNNELEKFISKRGCALVAAPRKQQGGKEEKPQDVSELRAYKDKFSFIGKYTRTPHHTLTAIQEPLR